MGGHSFVPAALMIVGAVIVLAGCAGDRAHRAVQFKPSPVAHVGQEDLHPVQPRTAAVRELLEAANAAFEEAERAQDAGDSDAALRHYTRMLELLDEAEIDPQVFYEFRSDLNRLMDEREATFALKTELDVPHPLPAQVLAEIREIQELYPRNFQGGLDRSYLYLPYIREEFRKAGLPQDLVWLAMVESQFTPKIVSPAGAGGMWQFMKSTGRRYGLRSDSYVDERYDWRKSTRAAIAYLTDLYHMFGGNWSLAVTAYNMGERGLEKAIAANGGETDLWKLMETPPAAHRMQRETKKFYPKLIASIIVAKDPERYGFKANPREPEGVMFASVKGGYSLAELDEAAGLPKGTLQRLNPQFIRGMTPSDAEVALAMPVEARVQLAAALERAPKLRTGTHVVKRGETLSGIATAYQVALNDLMRVNNIRSAGRLQVGQRLVIPGEGRLVEEPAVGGPEEIVVASAPRTTHMVQRGDTLSKIAARHGATVSQIQAWNNMGRRTAIRVGETLVVSAPKTAPARPSGPPVIHVVQAGEYPARIAAAYRVNLDDFLAWNNLDRASTIHVGDKLKVYPPDADVTVANTTPDGASRPLPPEAANAPSIASDGPDVSTAGNGPKRVHKVAPGENASIIASKYNVPTTDFLTWNNLRPESIIRVGDEYVVYSAGEGEPEFRVAASPQPVTHTVRKGENPTTIARRYGVKVADLFKWNGWGRSHVLHIGDEVIVSAR